MARLQHALLVGSGIIIITFRTTISSLIGIQGSSLPLNATVNGRTTRQEPVIVSCYRSSQPVAGLRYSLNTKIDIVCLIRRAVDVLDDITFIFLQSISQSGRILGISIAIVSDYRVVNANHRILGSFVIVAEDCDTPAICRLIVDNGRMSHGKLAARDI